MFKNKKFLKYLIIFTCSISITSYTLKELFSLYKPIQKKTNYNSIKKNHRFLIKNIAGSIKVFENGEDKPIFIMNVKPSTLPEYDQQMLKNGIYVNSLKQLKNLIEDYED